MQHDAKLAQVKVERCPGSTPTEVARSVLSDALDEAYRSYTPPPGETLPPRDIFDVRESSNIGGEVLLGYFVKGFVTGTGGALATKVVHELWKRAEGYIRHERSHDVTLVSEPVAEKEPEEGARTSAPRA